MSTWRLSFICRFAPIRLGTNALPSLEVPISAISLIPRKGGLSVSQRLLLIVLAIAIPMLFLLGGVVWRLAEHERQTRLDAAMYTSRAIRNAVDAQLSKYGAVAQALAASPSLQSADLSEFRKEAERALIGIPRTWVVVTDLQKRQLMNTLVPVGQKIAHVAPVPSSDLDRAFKTGQMQVADVTFGPIAKIPVVAVGLPVFRAGKPTYYLLIVVDVTVFRDLLSTQRTPEGWLVAVIDREGKFVARSRGHDRWVGKPAAASWRAVRHWEGLFETTSLENKPLTTANSVSKLSNWAVAAAMERETFTAPVWRAYAAANLIGFIVILASVLIASLAARKIAIAITTLESGAMALERREVLPVSGKTTGVREVDHALNAFDVASQTLLEQELRRTKAEEKLRTLNEELLHVARVNELGQVSAGIAHELNQPLTAMLNYSSLAKRLLEKSGPVDVAKATDAVERAGAQAVRASEIIRRMRNFVERRATDYKLENINQIVAESIALALIGVKAENIMTNTNLARDLPPVYADRVQIQQVLVNLLRNAVEAVATSQRREITISTVRTSDECVEVSVTDTGPGISTEIAGRLFKPFATTKADGMGIGLAISYSIIETHGGHLQTIPEPSGGTIFSFTLPIAKHRGAA